MSLEHTKNRLENAESRRDKFVDQNIVDWAEQMILLPTQKAILQLGLSQNAANAVSIVKTGFMKTKIRWDYLGPEGEPLYLWLENGFGKGGYDIEAKGKQHGGKDYMKFKDSSGGNVFRKKVRHPGFFGYQVIRKTWDENKDKLKQRIIEETNNFYKVNQL